VTSGTSLLASLSLSLSGGDFLGATSEATSSEEAAAVARASIVKEGEKRLDVEEQRDEGDEVRFCAVTFWVARE
jgi:hypothetical protein